MCTSRYFVSAALLLASFSAAWRDKVLMPGTPPLTESMVKDYYRYVEWRWPEALTRLGGPKRLAQLIANDWRNGNKVRETAFLADLKGWRANGPRLSRMQRERLVASNRVPSQYLGELRQAPGAEARLLAQQFHALQLARLQQMNDARQLQLRALSNLQASHHETVMTIINNMRLSGRYEYNPATGRYDRWVPYR